MILDIVDEEYDVIYNAMDFVMMYGQYTSRPFSVSHHIRQYVLTVLVDYHKPVLWLVTILGVKLLLCFEPQSESLLMMSSVPPNSTRP